MEGPTITALPHTGDSLKPPGSSELPFIRGHAPDSGVPVDSELGTPFTPHSSELSDYGTGGGLSEGDESDMKTGAQTEEQSLPDKCQGLPETDKILQEAQVVRSVSHPLDSSHTVTYTVTIAFAVPPSPTKDDDISTQDTNAKKNQKQKKLIDRPRPQGYYHFEYHLLPEHTEPTKADVVLFGVVAKLYIEHESRILKPWCENGKVWLIWSHNIELLVTKATILKALHHQIQVNIWDTKDKVSPRARFDKPKAFRLGEDSEEKQLILNQRKHFVDSQPRPSFVLNLKKDAEVSAGHTTLQESSCVTEQAGLLATTPVPFSASPLYKQPESSLEKCSRGSDDDLQSLEAALRKYRFNQKSAKGHKADGISSKSRKKSLDSSKNEKPLSAVSSHSERKCLGLSMSLKPFLAGELTVTERLQETSGKVLDGYLTLVTNAPLLSEDQRRELNPLVIRVLSATSLPTEPTSVHILKEKCLPVYCKYKFYDQPFHCTHGQEHGTHVYFKDINVILAGTINPSELLEYLNGPPLEIEVHDRDRKTTVCESTPSLYGNEPEDEKLSNVGLVASKRTLQNPFTKDRLWDPYGIAKVRLTDLVQGARYLNIHVPIHDAPNPSRCRIGDKNGNRIGIAGSANDRDSPLPMGHYLDSQSLLKVRVDIAVPLSLETSVTDGPYSRIIYIFDYKNRRLLHSVIREITEINAKALNLDGTPHDKIYSVLARIDLTDGQREDPTLDIITGIHVMDGSFHLFVLEGLKDKGIKMLWENLPSRTVEAVEGKVEILYNSQMSFCDRVYKDLDVLLSHIHLHQTLSFIMKQPTLYIRDMVPSASFQALSRLNYICSAKNLRDIIQIDLLPTAEMVSVLSREFGIPVSLADMFSECEEPFSNTLVKSQDRIQTSNFRRCPLRDSLDNYNENYIKWKQEYSPHTDYIQHNIEKLHLSRPVPKMTKKYVEIDPDDSVAAHKYSCQSFNYTQHARRILLQEMAKEPNQRFTYSQEYSSATVSPVDPEQERKEEAAKSKQKWMTQTGFLYPGFISGIKSNAHPKQPDEARITDLTKAWKENILHANTLNPTLTRDRWSWEQREIDFDLYTKYHDHFTLSAPGAIHLAGENRRAEEKEATQAEYTKWLQNIKVDKLQMRFHRCLPKTEMTSRGVKASDQQSILKGLLKDPPFKFSLCRTGFSLQCTPALAILPNGGVNVGTVKEVNLGFMPGDALNHSLKLDRNRLPRHDMEHKQFQKLKGKDFDLFSCDHSLIHKRGIKDLRCEERDAFLVRQEAEETPETKIIQEPRNITQTQTYAGFLLHIK